MALLTGLKLTNGHQRLIEHTDHGVEISLVVHAAENEKVREGLAVENRQFGFSASISKKIN